MKKLLSILSVLFLYAIVLTPFILMSIGIVYLTVNVSIYFMILILIACFIEVFWIALILILINPDDIKEQPDIVYLK